MFVPKHLPAKAAKCCGIAMVCISGNMHKVWTNTQSYPWSSPWKTTAEADAVVQARIRPPTVWVCVASDTADPALFYGLTRLLPCSHAALRFYNSTIFTKFIGVCSQLKSIRLCFLLYLFVRDSGISFPHKIRITWRIGAIHMLASSASFVASLGPFPLCWMANICRGIVPET